MFKWFWTIFSLGAPVYNEKGERCKLYIFDYSRVRRITYGSSIN